nr:hypothetical protein [Euryarchaeota archaeon]
MGRFTFITLLISILLLFSTAWSDGVASGLQSHQKLEVLFHISLSNNSSANTTTGDSWSENRGMEFQLDPNTGNFQLISNYYPVGLNEDPSGIYSTMLTHIDIFDTSLGVNYTLGTEVTSNTLSCRQATGNPVSQLLFFSTDDGSIYGNGWHWPTFSGQGNVSWNISYTFFAPSRGWIATVSSFYQNGNLKFSTHLDVLNYTQPWLRMKPPITNTIGIDQYEYDLIRLNLLYHNSSISNIPSMCKILNEANTYYRQRGIYLSIEQLSEVNPNNQTEPKPLNWNTPNSQCNNDNLRSSIYNYKITNLHVNWYFDHIDSALYLYYDDGNNHDGLSWNVGTLIGCATNRYWDTSINKAGLEGVGDGWIRMLPISQSSNSFIRHHAILIAHEIGHTLGAPHKLSEASWRGNSTNGYCGGDNSDDKYVSPTSSASEGDFRSIMTNQMNYDLISCYGTPFFSNQTYDYWLNNGSLSGLRYKHIQPAWHNWSQRASEHGPQLEYWFVQVDANKIIDVSNQQQHLWKIAYSTKVLNMSSPLFPNTMSFNSCTSFFGIRTIANSTLLEHYDAWQGYVKFNPCENMRIVNGDSRNYWSNPLWIRGLEDYDGTQPPDDYARHQYSSKVNLTTSATWIIWPAYSQAITNNTYGPWQWMALTWEQSN